MTTEQAIYTAFTGMGNPVIPMPVTLAEAQRLAIEWTSEHYPALYINDGHVIVAVYEGGVEIPNPL